MAKKRLEDLLPTIMWHGVPYVREHRVLHKNRPSTLEYLVPVEPTKFRTYVRALRKLMHELERHAAFHLVMNRQAFVQKGLRIAHEQVTVGAMLDYLRTGYSPICWSPEHRGDNGWVLCAYIGPEIVGEYDGKG
jgi:hypothetical protein